MTSNPLKSDTHFDSSRLYLLDMLRGFSAIGIMVYHFLTWGDSLKEDSGNVIVRMGIYCVSLFYILSGLTLYHVYHDKLDGTFRSLKNFYVKRAFRIFPLLWLVTIFSILILTPALTFLDIFLNFTGLFGIYRWDKAFSIGAWSIGNELVFYLVFPLLIILKKRSTLLLICICLISLALYLWFAFGLLNKENTLGGQWNNYSNPLNQIFLFVGGVLVGMVFKDTLVNQKRNQLLLIILISFFVFYPVSGEMIHLVTGTNRIVFTIICLGICFSVFKLLIRLPQFLIKPFSIIGQASYAIYLIHPLVWFGWNKLVHLIPFLFSPVSLIPKFIILTCASLLIGYIIYLKFEKIFIKRGLNHIE